MKKYAALRQLSLESLYNTFLGLPPRHQTFWLVGVIAAAVLILVVPLSLASAKLGRLDEKIV
ncbi:MAG: hypothetical protein HY543_03865, partial [Deltaproteobacteria bacterium]|nr:hypothetical protein [Deltaproteobacteria bacterium]